MSDPGEMRGDAGSTTPVGNAAASRTRERIGPYRLLSQIGEGGCGIVHLAEQIEPVRRRVAIKLIKPGMDSKAVLARFQIERQALALMDHPYIAKIHDGGMTERGRPYFVMEYVAGEPVTKFCDRERLSVRERLQLMIRICHAVQHAHSKGVIHRDIKPSNVLVEFRDGEPSPKVIDFGVAKALNQQLTEATIFTGQGQIIGTPEYMSPEQAEMSPLNIDTRTDVYALGVMLYELLTGVRPFDLARQPWHEFQRIIREEEPTRPSTKLHDIISGTAGSPGTAGDEVARRRRLDARTLVRRLRSDLDWVVMRCLEKERSRRYQTADELARELERFLNDEPVLAGPPSTVYRFRKFARRHRVFIGATTFSLLALVGGLIVATFGVVAAVEQRNEARNARHEAEVVSGFLVDMLAKARPSDGRETTVRELLDLSAKQIAADFAEQPVLQARLRDTIGWSYFNLGRIEPAADHLEAALASSRGELGDDHRSTMRLMTRLAVIRNRQRELEGALALYQEVLPMQERVLGETDRDTLQTMNNLANLYKKMDRLDDAERLHKRTLDLRRSSFGNTDTDTMESIYNLGNLYYSRLQRFDKAVPLLVEVLELRRDHYGPDHFKTLNVMNSLGDIYMQQERWSDAGRMLKAAADGLERAYEGEDHRDRSASMFNVTALYIQQERWDEALPYARGSYRIDRSAYGPTGTATLDAADNLVRVLLALELNEEAETLLRELHAACVRDRGAEHEWTRKFESLLKVVTSR